MTVSASFADQIRERETFIDAEIDNLIKNADRTGSRDEGLKDLIEKIRKRRGLLAIKPEFTPEVVGIAKQIIAFGGAGFAFVLTFSQSLPREFSNLTVALALLYVNITLVSMCILVWFFCQARTRYPWLYLERLGNSSQYFYYNAIPMDYLYRPFYAPWNRDADRRQDLQRFIDSLSSFAKRSIDETRVNELKNELIQYHLLIFYQGYLDQYEQQLTHIALYGFMASVVATILVTIARTLM